MNKSNISLPDSIIEALDAEDWCVCSVNEQRGEYVAELEKYSPAGEDFIAVIWFDGSPDGFVEAFQQYATDFDPDEHADMWIENRHSVRGVPSVRELIDDADAIDNMLSHMASTLSEVNTDDEWEEYIRSHWQNIIESAIPYGRISHDIGWGFSDDDLRELMRMHSENICREKIEDLLEDCNFHTECGNWHDGNYIICED